MVQIVRPLKEGFLTKQGGSQSSYSSFKNALGLQTWKKRYFTLKTPLPPPHSTSSVLEYRATFEGRDPLGHLDLDGCRVAPCEHAKQKHVFAVTKADGKRMLLSADTEEERGAWVAAITKAINLAIMGRGMRLQHGIKDTSGYAGAEAAYREALAADPTIADAWSLLGDVLIAREDWDGAEAAYRSSIEQRAIEKCHVEVVMRASAHRDLGRILQFKRGDLEGAEDHYRMAIELFPADKPTRGRDCAEVYLGLGNLLGARGDFDGAVAAFREGMELDQGEKGTDCCGNLATFLATKKEDLAGAVEAGEALLRRGGDESFLLLLAVWSQKIGARSSEREAKEAAYRRALDFLKRSVEKGAFPPGEPREDIAGPICRNLSSLLERHGDVAGAVEVVEEYVRLVPDDEDGPKRRAQIERLAKLRDLLA